MTPLLLISLILSSFSFSQDTTMRSLFWSVLGLFSALLASAHAAKRCSAPPEYPHARVDARFRSRGGFSSGQEVRFRCPEDFSPRGNPIVHCWHGKWTKLMLKCEKRMCGNAGDLPNGQFDYKGNSFIGQKIFAICNEGFTLKELNYMICKSSGWTGDFPKCEERAATCSSPAVDHSVKAGGTVSLYQVGDNVTFTCSGGFQLDGAPQVTCGPGGQWLPRLPRCLPSSEGPEQLSRKEAGGCGKPLTIKTNNANLADKYILKTTFRSGDRVHYTCDVGHAPAGGNTMRTCRNGKWTPLFLKCELKQCGSAGEILNGQFTYTGLEFGDTATAVCDNGYSLVGRATRRCKDNGWDGRVPVCEAVVCEEAPEGTNAERSNLQEPPYTFRSVIGYRCREGTLVGPKEIWCTHNGTWSSPPPQCKVITCAPPIVSRASWAGAQMNLYQYRDTISIECHTGYNMIGQSFVTCGQDGQWSPGLPKCTRTWRRVGK
ncbi:sushi, von Willebrand factor type A, EGF and pentraxin domain-containing protein 1 isoform X2 [Pleuronectes platessa]|uniref:sushi, von Willebrand factor type A, EGF and pentraxin domain-containing protein 1 isoform X2 n=1 Tax=Pleuronectes platessa TaxID=8262 RepID=UPI00232A4929|nr:sushi, von Willebrand factor type A, EGF and pentraxin domain-containing protein 1 isoform X2 [Pleuronectes platessa]